MALRIERVIHRFFDDAVRLILDALPALVADDILLIGKTRLIDHIEQVSHAIRFQPETKLELVRRQGLEGSGRLRAGHGARDENDTQHGECTGTARFSHEKALSFLTDTLPRSPGRWKPKGFRL